jgi:hypothetical protein
MSHTRRWIGLLAPKYFTCRETHFYVRKHRSRNAPNLKFVMLVAKRAEPEVRAAGFPPCSEEREFDILYCACRESKVARASPHIGAKYIDI